MTILDLKPGDYFVLEGQIFMKCKPDKQTLAVRAVDPHNGEIITFTKNTNVVPVFRRKKENEYVNNTEGGEKMGDTFKRGRLEPILDKHVIDQLEELRKAAIPLFEQCIADDDDLDDKLAEAIEHIEDANAYFALYHAAVVRAERALKEYRKKE